ncbi:unnamed protein product [Parascedosporium putredinis]|uniref:RTA1-domain-containing protein n=1 Tax=Parascedosporium putredinis TaxID=1442378 RepID=A0A9P1H5R9_9PEZI|nr:unnamed protein product [Parascedosporium putredinis]CAI7997353.1 unnamed protein product [Parascedosporium putredinis]
MATNGGEFVFYHYTPSVAAAAIFTVLFLGSGAWHVKQLVSARVWYFIPFVIGCVFEGIGYIGRILSWAERPDYTKNPYIIQSMMLLLPPALFAASIYMILGRLIVRLEADALSIIRPRWLTKFFIFGDVLSFCAQGGGGGMLATAKSKDDSAAASKSSSAASASRSSSSASSSSSPASSTSASAAAPPPLPHPLHPWRGLLYALYASSILIMIRSVFRIIEYVMGSDGELLSKEVYLYVFDAVPMLAVCIMFNWFHPSRVISSHAADKEPITSVTSLEVLGIDPEDPESARRKSKQWNSTPLVNSPQSPPHSSGHNQRQHQNYQQYNQEYSSQYR